MRGGIVPHRESTAYEDGRRIGREEGLRENAPLLWMGVGIGVPIGALIVMVTRWLSV